MIVTTVQLSPRAPSGDIKAMHDIVMHAALAGEQPRPVLWAQPKPQVLAIRHDRAIAVTDLPPGWCERVSHAPYWLPPHGAVIDWAVTVDAGQSGQSHGQWARECAEIAAGTSGRRSPRGARKARTVRSPQQMLELIADRLAPVLAVDSAEVASHTHRVGRRPREGGRVMHSNQVLIRGDGTVTDAPALHQLMLDGVGRHRSFGCGLILARPSVVREPAW